MFEGFVHPALAAGAALAAVPLVIHLLNRQRHKPVPWAAMRFVLAAHKRTRRRVQMENWLLLLLRMAAVALLALAVARPFTGSESPLAGLTETRRDLALVLDVSASTGYREDVETVFERIVTRARELVSELDAARGDRVQLVLGGGRARLAASGDPRQALAVLETLSAPTDERFDLVAALGAVYDFAREEAAGTEESRVEVRLLSDLQRNAFAPRAATAEGEPPVDDVLAVLDQLAGLGLGVVVEDLGPRDATPPNLALAAIEAPLGGLATGAPLDLTVRVANHGVIGRQAVRVALEVDGERRPSQMLDLAARGEAEAHFPLLFDQPGEHVVRAALEGDRLAVDDARVEVMSVPAPVRVLLVDGRPAPELERDAAGRLSVVLDPTVAEGPGGARSPFALSEVLPRDLEGGDVDLAEFDLVWLCDVDSLTPAAVARLEAATAAGAALVISLGDEVQLDTFNARMFRADGAGLAPAELVRTVATASRRGEYWRVHEFDETHPALALFAEERWRPLFTEGPVWQFVATRPHADARVLARLDDPAGSALLLSRPYDRGEVYLWTSSMDESWTALPTWGPFLVPFVYDLVRHAGTPPAPRTALEPGTSFTAEVQSFPRRLELVLPDETRRPLTDEPEKVADGVWRLPVVDGALTERVGLYRVLADGAPLRAFAVQLPGDESDLERMSHGELEGLHPALAVFDPAAADADAAGAPPRRGELWRWLALLCLAALVGESLWGAWIGNRRRVVR
ncbi:MAG: BatA domain-containing protein [Planctomycetes bacterium]|nr:BatA domain-containing protein [Planctomycetota bacterium]